MKNYQVRTSTVNTRCAAQRHAARGAGAFYVQVLMYFYNSKKSEICTNSEICTSGKDKLTDMYNNICNLFIVASKIAGQTQRYVQ